MPRAKRAKKPKRPTPKRIKVATGRRLTPKRATLTKVKKGQIKKKKRRIEAEAMVISPRGRKILPGGVLDPSTAPPSTMPQSTQDYFLTSRAIRRMAYDTKKGILEIIFQTGYGYHFYGVPQTVWNSLKAAQSKGRFFMDYIYGHWSGPKGNKTYFPNYTYRRIQ